MLRQLFGLMVLAHYRTRPSDLKMLLDRDGMSIYIVRYQDTIVGSAWLVDEGGLDAELAQAVYRGQRRVAGHLLPQSLLSHAGLQSAGALRYRRLIRIAIHPQLQRKGLATALIEKLFDDCVQDDVDLLGTSFGVDTALIAFWQQAEFKSVRMGVQRDDVSGRHALLMLRASSDVGTETLASLCHRFDQHWLRSLSTQFADLESSLVLAISNQCQLMAESLSDWDWQDVNSFANHARTYESCQLALMQFVCVMLPKIDIVGLSNQQQQLLIMLFIQHHALTKVVEKLGFSGKQALIVALREAIGVLITSSEKAV
jgi:tRNA(Met) cytidine acetyltransferase